MKFNSIDEVQAEREKVASEYDGELPDVLMEYFDEEEIKLIKADYFKQKAINKKKYDWDEIKEYREKKEKEFWEENKTEIVKRKTTTEDYDEPPRATEHLDKENEMSDEQRRYIIGLCEDNINLFAVRYFPHYLKKPSSKLHRFLYDLVVREFKKRGQFKWAIAAPRGNAKSSIVSTILPLWCIIFEKKKFIILLSNTAGQAEDFLTDIKRELMNNELLQQDFPEACAKGSTWKIDEILTGNGARMLALGTGSKIRGRKFGVSRPDLIICHEKGTRMLYNDKWINIEDHPSAVAKISDGYEVKVWGLPFSEVVTKEHRYFGRTITKYCNKNYLDDPEWIEVNSIRCDSRKKYYIGYKIDYRVEAPHSIPTYKPRIKNRDVNSGRVTAVDNTFMDIVPDEFYDPEFWWFVGLWWGDGYSSGKHRLNITIADKDIYIFDKLKRLLSKYNRKWLVDEKESACFQVIFSWSKFARWLKSWRVGNSKKIPPIWVERLPLDYQKELLRGYIDADGFVDKDKQEIRLTSIYLDGLLCIRRILSRFGIAASIREGVDEHTEYVEGRKINCQKKYDLRFRDNAYKLGYDIYNQTRYKYTRSFIKDGYLWSKVRSIDDVEDRTFTPIKTDNSVYITHFGVSHNCDDLEDSEMVRSESQRDFVRFHWFDKDVLYAGDDSTDFLIVGTILGKDSLLEALMSIDEYPQWSSRRFKAVEKFSESELWNEWAKKYKDRFDVNRQDTARAFFEEHKDEMLEGTEVLWPDGDPYYDLMIYKVSNPSGFECFDKDTEIILSNLESKKICDVCVGDKILSGDGSTQSVVDIGTSDLRDRKIFDIKVVGYDKKFRVTEDHPFLIYPRLNIKGINCTHQHIGKVKNGTGGISKNADRRIINNHLVWKKAEDLNISDAVVFPYNKCGLNTCEYCNKPDDWLFMVGLYIADGSIGSNGNLVQFSMHSDENEILDRVRNFIGKGTIHTYDNASRLDISSKELASTLECFGSLSHEKTLSYLKDNLCEVCFMKLLDGIIVGDGYITHGREYRSINSASYTLIRELQYSLYRFGLVSYTYKLRDSGKCIIRNREVNQRELYQLALVYENANSRPLQSWFFKDKMYSKIQSIKEVDVDTTYRPYWMSVTGDKTFCIPRAVVHNSEKQNNPLDPNKILVTEKQLHFEYFRQNKEVFDDIEKGVMFGAIDPSLGKKGGDDSVICTIVRGYKSGYLYVIDFDIKNRSVDDQIDDMLRLHQMHPYKLFGVETNAFQYVIAENLRKKGRKKGINIPIKERHQYHDKKMRFEGIVPLLTDGTVVFDKTKRHQSQKYGSAIDQIVTFTGENDRRDDAVDALVLAVEIAAQPRFKMINKSTKDRRSYYKRKRKR